MIPLLHHLEIQLYYHNQYLYWQQSRLVERVFLQVIPIKKTWYRWYFLFLCNLTIHDNQHIDCVNNLVFHSNTFYPLISSWNILNYNVFLGQQLSH